MTNEYYNNDELMHYGVLGMKWGVRRASKMASKSQSLRTKSEKYASEGKTKKANALQAKANKLQNKSIKKMNKHTEFSGGKETVDRVRKQKLGKTVAQSLLFGTYGALKYNEARAASKSRGRAALNAVLWNAANEATLGLASVVEPRTRKNPTRKKIQNSVQDTARSVVKDTKSYLGG